MGISRAHLSLSFKRTISYCVLSFFILLTLMMWRIQNNLFLSFPFMFTADTFSFILQPTSLALKMMRNDFRNFGVLQCSKLYIILYINIRKEKVRWQHQNTLLFPQAILYIHILSAQNFAIFFLSSCNFKMSNHKSSHGLRT